MYIGLYVSLYLIFTGIDNAIGLWCHKCKGTDNDACLGRAHQCDNGQFCASTFERAQDDPLSVTMVRKRCATKCTQPGELECNNRNTKCTYCCQGDGCNSDLAFNAGRDSADGSEPCYLPVCVDEDTKKPKVKVSSQEQVQALLQSHHEQMKSRVAFSVHSDAVTEGYGAHHVVRFPSIFTNIGGLFDGVANLAELTITKAGLYHLSVHVVATDGGDSAMLTLKLNGHVLLHSKPIDFRTSNYILPTGYIQTVLSLDEGDAVQLAVEEVTEESRTSPSDVIFNGYLIA